MLIFSIDRIISTGKKFAAIYVLMLVVLITITNLKSNEFFIFFFAKNTRDSGYMNIGNWAKNKIPSGSIIGATQSGTIRIFRLITRRSISDLTQIESINDFKTWGSIWNVYKVNY